MANFGTSMFKPHSASISSVNSDNISKSNMSSAFETGGSGRRKRESKLVNKQGMLATRFEKFNYSSENNDHGESFNESSSMSLKTGSNFNNHPHVNQQIYPLGSNQAMIPRLQASLAPPASPADYNQNTTNSN